MKLRLAATVRHPIAVDMRRKDLAVTQQNLGSGYEIAAGSVEAPQLGKALERAARGAGFDVGSTKGGLGGEKAKIAERAESPEQIQRGAANATRRGELSLKTGGAWDQMPGAFLRGDRSPAFAPIGRSGAEMASNFPSAFTAAGKGLRLWDTALSGSRWRRPKLRAA